MVPVNAGVQTRKKISPKIILNLNTHITELFAIIFLGKKNCLNIIGLKGRQIISLVGVATCLPPAQFPHNPPPHPRCLQRTLHTSHFVYKCADKKNINLLELVMVLML